MHLTSVAGYLGAENLQKVTELLDAAWGESDLGPFANRRWFSLTEPDTVLSDMEGFLLDGANNDTIDGYIEIIATSTGSTFKYAMRPSVRTANHDAERALIDAALSHPIVDLNTPIYLWTRDPRTDDDEAALAAGFVFDRNLFHMQRSLVNLGELTLDPKFTTRAFRPGIDEQKWLALNNAAFATHPEQGNWTLSDLRERTEQLWFSPDGFLLHEHKKKIVAFCWTKIDPVGGDSGEIYVVGVDPSEHGRGLGKKMTVAALHYLASVGCSTVDLYVDSANTAALSMYQHLGFAPIETDRAYFRKPGARTDVLS